ncbi:Mitochondrial ATPase complex subunit atp10 [Rhinocladiella similis]
MGREEICSLFVALVLRPHSRCIYRSRQTWVRQIRLASSSNTPSTAPTRQELPKKPNVPLHVGLDRNPDAVSAISRIPIPRGERGEKFTPSVLSRPLGLEHPPLPGQNSPVDTRSLRERKEDFANYQKALERRRIYLRSYFRPYFQEWSRTEHYKGKSFVSNERLFRRDKALYFPNIWGPTLAKEGDGPDGGRDITPAITGKISLIGMQSGQWAEEQVDTFFGSKDNPDLSRIMAASNGLVQRVDVNIQGDWIRAWLVKMFRGRLRSMIPEDRWDKYFMIKLPRDIRRGLTDDVRDAMGLLNSQVGYVYLVDSSCKIRWAGSGHAWEGEVAGLNSALQRLIQEERKLQSS